MFLTMILSKKYLLQQNSTELCLKKEKHFPRLSNSRWQWQKCTTLLIITIASISGTILVLWWAHNITIITKYVFTEWMNRWTFDKWFKMRCKLQRVIQIQTIAVSIQLRAGFMRLYVRSPEQAGGGDAEGRVEFGYNANSGWCPIHPTGMIHSTSWARVPLHSPTSSLTDRE